SRARVRLTSAGRTRQKRQKTDQGRLWRRPSSLYICPLYVNSHTGINVTVALDSAAAGDLRLFWRACHPPPTSPFPLDAARESTCSSPFRTLQGGKVRGERKEGGSLSLKTLPLRGFKSFASATTLRLEPGITCVVGPN